LIGSVLGGKYRIRDLLGRGGMGEVYEAEDTSTGLRVAVKVIHVGTPAELKDLLPRFRREAKAAMVIDSPHIARTLETGVDPETSAPFTVMELLAGEDLQQLLHRLGPLPPDLALRIVAQTCQGLVDAHASGVVHRDIKPGNIFLVRGKNGEITVKILDFGIAKLGEMYEVETAVLTRTGSMLGSPLYMSPEQARGIKNIDHRTDLWSLGVVLYCALAGRTPNQDIEAFGDLIIALCSQPSTPIQELAPWVAPDVAAVVDAALQIRADHRFQSAAEMLDALKPLLPDGLALREEMLVPLAEVDRASVAPHFEATVMSTDFDRPARTTGARSRRVNNGGDETVASHPGTPGSGRLSAPVSGPRSGPTAELATERISMPISASAPGRISSAASGRSSTPAAAPVSTPIGDPERVSTPADAPTSAPGEAPGAAPRRPRSWKFGAGILAATLAVAAAAGVLLQWRGAARPDPAPPTASASALPSTTAMTSLPPPAECSPAALVEYRAGMQSLHEGVWEQAHASFERATVADPSCAEAHLRLAMTGSFHYPLARAREVYRRAVQLRGKLQERDRLLLDALEAIVRRDPPDHQEYGARLRLLAAQFPGDAELICLASFDTDNLEYKLRGLRRAIELDPQYSDAWQGLGHALDQMGKTEEAAAAFDDCLRAAPNSVDCVRGRIGLLQRTGHCDAMAADARLWIARDPTTATGYLSLAVALAATGESTEMVEEVLRQRASKLPEAERARAQLAELALLDALRGNFERATERAHELQKLVESDPNLGPHLRATLLLVEIMLETGQTTQAVALASDFQKRKGAWSVSATEVDTQTEASYLELLLLGAKRGAGLLKDREWQGARDAWIDAVRRGRTPAEETLWTLGVAMLATTPAEAVEAIRKLPVQSESTAGDMRSQLALSGALLGRTLLLAGKTDEALPYLRVASGSCVALSSPFVHTRAHFSLGQALESKKDKPAACAAYRVVHDRWGAATPPSETARRARERAEALGCGR
jgi:serine/threonine-protein kinase